MIQLEPFCTRTKLLLNRLLFHQTKIKFTTKLVKYKSYLENPSNPLYSLLIGKMRVFLKMCDERLLADFHGAVVVILHHSVEAGVRIVGNRL